MELLPAYLDYDAMVKHRFLLRNEQFHQYRLIFDRRRAVHVTLPALSLFDYQAKQRYVVTREEAIEHERRWRQLANTPQLRRQWLLHLSTTPVITSDISQAILGIRPT